MSSRVARKAITLPKDVDVKLDAQQLLNVKGKLGELQIKVHPEIKLTVDDGAIKVSTRNNSRQAHVMSGTTRALVNNMVTGVHTGFEKKLQLVGVGYRTQVKGSALELTLGFSHPVSFPIPKGIKIQTPSQTEIVVSGIDKQQVGQVAANIRAYRPPEPYKGKGVRYSDERIIIKETKK